MTATELWKSKLVFPTETLQSIDEFYRAIKEDLTLSGTAMESYFIEPLTEKYHDLLLPQIMAVLLHRANTKPGAGVNPWPHISKKAQTILMKKYGILEKHTRVLLVGRDEVSLAKAVGYTAITYARTTLRKVKKCSSRELATGFRNYTAYDDGGWFQTLIQCGLLIVDCSGTDYFGNIYVSGNIGELLNERMTWGHSTMFVIHLAGSKYNAAFEDGNIDVLSGMIEEYVSGRSRHGGNEWILPFIIGPNAYWVLID